MGRPNLRHHELFRYTLTDGTVFRDGPKSVRNDPPAILPGQLN